MTRTLRSSLQGMSVPILGYLLLTLSMELKQRRQRISQTWGLLCSCGSFEEFKCSNAFKMLYPLFITLQAVWGAARCSGKILDIVDSWRDLNLSSLLIDLGKLLLRISFFSLAIKNHDTVNLKKCSLSNYLLYSNSCRIVGLYLFIHACTWRGKCQRSFLICQNDLGNINLFPNVEIAVTTLSLGGSSFLLLL